MNKNKDIYNENAKRGTLECPFDYHLINKYHERFNMPYHYHKEFEIIRMGRGSLNIYINEKLYHLKEGDCLLIPPGAVHGGKTNSIDDYYDCVVFDLLEIYDDKRPITSIISKINDQYIQFEMFYSKEKKENLQIIDSIDAILNNIKSNNKFKGLFVSSHLLNLIGNLLNSEYVYDLKDTINSNYLKHVKKTSKIFRYIFDNFKEDITLKELSDVLGLNPKYFCRFFKELTNLRPIDYINKFRIENAAFRLEVESTSISQIAYSCGFKDPCYFTKLFRRYKKMSPKEYRNQYLKSKNLNCK